MSNLHIVSERLTTKPPSDIVLLIDTGQVGGLLRWDVVFGQIKTAGVTWLRVSRQDYCAHMLYYYYCYIIVIIDVFLKG